MGATVARLTDRTTLRHPNRRPETAAECYDWLAARFTDYNWTPAEMRAAELTFLPASPVADRMAAFR